MSSTSPAGVVEQMLDHASNARWQELDDLLSPDFEIVEPGSLPYGGVHRGVHGYVALMQTIDALFELSFEPQRLIALDDADVLLRMTVTFTPERPGAVPGCACSSCSGSMTVASSAARSSLMTRRSSWRHSPLERRTSIADLPDACWDAR